MLASFVANPEAITPAEMDRWCREFDSWAICDTLCFNLFDRTPHAWHKVAPGAARSGEFERRTAFALLWSLAIHDKQAPDKPFLHGLELIERAAGDDRNFVKKAVAMALRRDRQTQPTPPGRRGGRCRTSGRIGAALGTLDWKGRSAELEE